MHLFTKMWQKYVELCVIFHMLLEVVKGVLG